MELHLFSDDYNCDSGTGTALAAGATTSYDILDPDPVKGITFYIGQSSIVLGPNFTICVDILNPN